jgi:hypothetical protein
MSEKIKMRDGDTMLIMVKDGAVIHFTPNMGLPHSEFVKRATGPLPAGACAELGSHLNIVQLTCEELPVIVWGCRDL